ncbi:hypothetical protein TrVE_jg3152 [Triparma verrucosa]|uniref:Dynein heavy chain, cytoplasmic n=1 Tax=Triparma verrucosa TaxID=1606542 RepID=A0A9W7BN45_9STRA|nr:hypothetical protein TrVE_jg3152 [Triparma verrucosa]
MTSCIEFLRSAVELMLGASLPPGLVASDEFQKGAKPRLFVFILQEGTVDASNSNPSSTHLGCVAFSSRTPGSPITSKSQVNTISFPPSESTVDAASNPLFSSLQAHSSCFLPAVESVWSDSNGLEKKLSTFSSKVREFDVVLDQLKHTANVRPPQLSPHPKILELLNSFSPDLNPSVPTSTPIDLKDIDTQDLLSDNEFLNDLQQNVNAWIVELNQLTVLCTSSKFPNDAIEEKSFWQALGAVLESTRQALISAPSVTLTVSIMKKANRIVTTAALENENSTNIKDAIETVEDVNNFLQDFPIEDLQSASTLEVVTNTTKLMFNHYKKMRNTKNYDLLRLAKLLEASTSTLKTTVINILKTKNFMTSSFENFQEIDAEITELFNTWDAEYDRDQPGRESFRRFFKELHGRRGQLTSQETSFTTPLQLLNSLKFQHFPLKERWGVISSFRTKHNSLQITVESVLSYVSSSSLAAGAASLDASAILQLLSSAAASFSNADVMDLSDTGQEKFNIALTTYDNTIDEVEKQLASLLSSKLEAAKSAPNSAEEMFKHFSKFNKLFERPRIRAAVKDYQIDLISKVKDAVTSIQDKFLRSYEQSKTHTFAKIREIPSFAGKIMWAKLMENQLDLLMQRMEQVLGTGWEQEIEGRLLKKTCNELKSKLNSEASFKKWRSSWESELVVSRNKERLASYLIRIENTSNKAKFIATCNFEVKTIELFKEVRNLKWLNFDIPPTIQQMANDAFKKYPNAMKLNAALRSYAHTRTTIDNELNLSALVEDELDAIKIQITEAFNASSGPTTSRKATKRINWESPNLKGWVATFSEHVFNLQEKVETLLEVISSVKESIGELETVEFSHEAVLAIIKAIQKLVDQLSLSGYSNLNMWVKSLDEQVGEKLSSRLASTLTSWAETYKSDPSNPLSLPEDGDQFLDGFKLVGVEIHLDKDQKISSNPKIPEIREMYLQNFNDFTDTVTALPRLSSQRYDVFAETSTSEPATFSDLIATMHASTPIISECYSIIEDHMTEATSYTSTWLEYQFLWDMDMNSISSLIGEDVRKWQKLLIEARNARSTLDSEDDHQEKKVGPIIISYSKVQQKVNMKYDSWQKEIQNFFAGILVRTMSNTLQKISAGKSKMEKISLEGATREVIEGVTYIKEMTQLHKILSKEVELLISSESMLKRQRYQLPPDWTSGDRLKSNLADIETILTRRSTQMNGMIPALQQRVRKEDKQIAKRVIDLSESWEKEKPLSGDVGPTVAMDKLAQYDMKIKEGIEDFDHLSSAKQALGLETSGDNKLKPLYEELEDLREVWTAMSPIHTSLEDILDIKWIAVDLLKIKKQYNELLESLRNIPSKVRQYDIFTHVHETIKSYSSNHPLLTELKTEALKERHWKGILKRLNLTVKYKDLTLNNLFSAGIIKKKKDVKEFLLVAQGEMALEEFLKQVKDHWQGCQLELVLYQNRVRLIKGWDLLFAKLEEHMSSLSSMKQSPYFKSVQEFQDESASWEDKLTRLQQIFDAWVDVQRRWVYLESIFFGSADIKAQLPSEYTKFKSVDTDFTQLMRKISQKPNIIDTLQIEGLQKQLERLTVLMTKIQKALGEYLAKQREAFSRFYFVGDEDLLEIIGNSNEPIKVMPHLGKMFAAIKTMKWDDLETTKKPNLVIFSDMTSKDGEVVPLKEKITVVEKAPVKSWLAIIESSMKETLAASLEKAVASQSKLSLSLEQKAEQEKFIEWASAFPAQIMILASLISWSMGIEAILTKAGDLKSFEKTLNAKLQLMATTVLNDLDAQTRKKFEQLITELVHQRDVTRVLHGQKVESPMDFKWLYHMRYNYNPNNKNLLEKLNINISNASFYYGFEYLGIGDRLVQTPLTDRCYLTLTQALHFRMGGNPFGPAGTGKTESVKALGAQLGRFVLVFNCDEAFDFNAMGRLFSGLCQVGAWGCFDEFNRLEERILSAVSQQILTIQRGLMAHSKTIELSGRPVSLHNDVGIFVTMNPGYAGRSNMPDNLKQLFRAVAMVTPDRKLIAQVMLFSQGIVSAEELSGKVVLLFQLCEEQLSIQSHYDFGLRALKTLLVSAGGLKRKALTSGGLKVEGAEKMAAIEKDVLIQGTCNNVVPKLVADDVPLFTSLLKAVFPGSEIQNMDDEVLLAALKKVTASSMLVPNPVWMEKILQLKQVLGFRHGVMCVGPSGSGKTTAWRTLLKAMEYVDGIKGECYLIDPKSFSKEALYGSLDATTMEWTDGVFTHTLRTIIANQRGESKKRHWILFDGDVDPEWAENLNSVLDDNKLLTLPSGERLSLPDNVNIVLEVDTLREATPATVSRCGMVWFSDDTVSLEMMLKHTIMVLGDPPETDKSGQNGEEKKDETDTFSATQLAFVAAIKPYFVTEDGTPPVVADMLNMGLQIKHIMNPSRGRLLTSLDALLQRGITLAKEYDENHIDFPMQGDHMNKFAKKWLLYSMQWAFAGSCVWSERKAFGERLSMAIDCGLPAGDDGLIAFRPRVGDGEWEAWFESVPKMEIESNKVTATDLVITTTDTVRHMDVLTSWIETRKPLILCGPPGSGKTMTLTSTLNNLPNVFLAPLNFSSGTTPDLILKTFQQHCEYVRTNKGIVLRPTQNIGVGRWLVIFCDEINLPKNDVYGTQAVISFMRLLTEQGGFWRQSDNVWIKLDRIQFVGACNPPTDAGRVQMTDRFMRHAPLLLVDFPSQNSLMQIYSTFNGGTLKLFPNLREEVTPLTEAMVEIYLENQKKFTVDIKPQYFYSPRELSRWMRAIYESVRDHDGLSREELVRLVAHEALRLFSDRLTNDEERDWCSFKIDEILNDKFPNLDPSVLQRPIMYSTWLTKSYSSVSRDDLRTFMAARLKVFYEEELNVPLVIFDEVMEHVVRIDRVLKQPMGHCLLVGDSGAGKTVLSKFVSWMNGLSIFQIKAHSKYSIDDFNEDLREIMRRSGVSCEKICFIFDESNSLDTSFLEAMNALLASGEVPGLFEGDDLVSLMSALKGAGSAGDGEEELWAKFTKNVQRNLHVVFTMNPTGEDFSNRSTTSPALFNRCVVDWFGTWGQTALGQVGKQFTSILDMGDEHEWNGGAGDEGGLEVAAEVFKDEMEAEGGKGSLRQAVVASMVNIHERTKTICEENNKIALCKNYVSPRDYLDLISNFVSICNEKRGGLQEQQLHVTRGLEKLRETQTQVAKLKEGLGAYEIELQSKEREANDKLQLMVADQNNAEKQKSEAARMNEEVTLQQTKIAERQKEANDELESAEPALISAQQSVKGIQKKQLDEMRALARPPENVRLTLEAVAVMLGERKLEWGEVRKMLQRSDFIASILDFDLDKLGDKQIKIVKEKYLSTENFNEDTVMRSSKACGPLFIWVNSQISYSEIFNKVEPLRAEVKQLQTDAEEAMIKKDQLDKEVEILEERIQGLKNDYAELIREVERIKTEVKDVKQKVDRAESLIESLAVESNRWEGSSGQFNEQLRSLVGDALLCASFLTYGGFFDHKRREALMSHWKKFLEGSSVVFEFLRSNGSLIEYLSKGSDRLAWEGLGLPKDALCVENAIMLERFNRFPLVIDPSGQATNFLMKKFADRKITKTSFLDGGFIKTLASAIRFGNVLLVQDVEAIDPILNPVLNKELMKTGGRTLVRLGSEDIDYSPKFSIFLSTRDAAVKLTPDLCSRVTLVNFTITPGSLKSQALSMLLRKEKPEMEGKRAEMMQLKGEQNVKLRELEEQLLAKISSVEGSILEDNSVIKSMEEIKGESAKVEKAIADGEVVMGEMERAIGEYDEISESISTLYFTIEGLTALNSFYQFSLELFIEVLEHVLQADTKAKSGEERHKEVKFIMFMEIMGRVARGLFGQDKLAFGIRMAMLWGGEFNVNNEGKSLETFMGNGITFADGVFGKEVGWHGRGLNHFKEIVEEEVKAKNPILLCSAPGYDVSRRVHELADSRSIKLSSIAMGNDEGYDIALQHISAGSKSGTWVILKNLHLCSRDWLMSLEKKLFSMKSHVDFRLFMTCEMREDVAGEILPLTLVKISDVFVCEAPFGLKASIKRFFGGIEESRFDQKPVEKGRLYMLVSWMYAVIQERLRYAPTGWSKTYEFSEADALNALDVVDAWIERVASGKAHVAPEIVPWDALKEILGVSVFGGRIDNEYDQRVLDSFLESAFVKETFDVDFPLVKGANRETLLTLPEGKSRKDFMGWVDQLPGQTDLEWLGLNGAAELGRLKSSGESVMKKVMLLGGGTTKSGRRSSMVGRGRTSSNVQDQVAACADYVEGWIGQLEHFEREVGSGDWAAGSSADFDSLQRCIAREILTGVEYLRAVMSDLKELSAYCKGGKKLSQKLKSLVDNIGAGVTPTEWKKLFDGGGQGSIGKNWITNFSKRIEQVKEFIATGGQGLDKVSFWVGGLFNAGSFITATRQFVARAENSSIDELELVLSVGDGGGGFSIEGLGMEGGLLEEGGSTIQLSDSLVDKLGICKFQWVKRGETEAGGKGTITLPVYLHIGDRQKIVVSVSFAEGGKKTDFWLQRGLALFFNC